MRYAVAVTGPSGSGKTTLIEKLVLYYSRQWRVCVIKHDPKDKARFDKEGKDSYRFFDAGADTVVVSPKKTVYQIHAQDTLQQTIERLGHCDYLFVEGLKTWPLPRIGVFRNRIEEEYLPFCDALAVDKSVDVSAYGLPQDVAILDLNDIASIASWITQYAKPIKG